MPDTATTTGNPTKSDLEDENARLRALLDDNGIDPDADPVGTHGVVGNFADLQRLGAIAVAEGTTNIDDAVVKPPSTDVDTGDVTPAETVSGNPVPGPS